MTYRLFSIFLFFNVLNISFAQDTEALYYEGLKSMTYMTQNQGNPGKMTHYGKKAAKLFRQIGFYEFYIKSSTFVARGYLQSNHVDSAKQIVDRNLELLTRVDQGGGAKGVTYFISGATYLTLGQTDSALFYLQKAQIIYDTLSNYIIATEYLPDSLAFIKDSYYSEFNKFAVSGNRDLLKARVFNYLGLAYMSTLEFDRALAFLKKAKSHYEKTIYFPELFSTLINLGQASLGNSNHRQERFDSAMVYFNQALRLTQQGGDGALLFKGAVKRFIALTALMFQRTDLTAKHYPGADSILSKAPIEVLAKLAQVPPEGLDLSLAIEKAWVLAATNKSEKAREVLIEIPSLFAEFEEQETYQKIDFVAELNLRLASTYALLEEWPAVHKYGQSVLSSLDINFGEDFFNPDLTAENFNPQPQLTDLKAIFAIAQLLEKQARISEDNKLWKSAYQYYRLAEKYINQNQFYYLGITGQTFFNENALFNADYFVGAIEDALIRIGYSLPDITSEAMFQHFEKGKAFVLSNAIDQRQWIRTMSDSVLEKDRFFQDRLGQIQSTLIREKNNPSQQTLLNERWLDTQREYETFNQKLIQQLSDTDRKNLGMDSVSLTEVQELLPDNSYAIFIYDFGEERDLHLFWIQKDSANTAKIVLPDEFDQLLKEYKAIIQSDVAAEEPAKIKAYLKSGYELYKLLVQPVLQQLKDVQHLIIVPDGELHTLEFDYLLTDSIDLNRRQLDQFVSSPDYNQLPLFIFRHSTQYINSMATLVSQRQINYLAGTDDNWQQYGVFQPRFQNFSWSTDLPDFPSSGADTVLHDLLPVDEFLKEAPSPRKQWLADHATEKNFRAAVSNLRFNIFHVYSHGLLHPNDPLSSSILLARSPGNPTRDEISIRDLYTLSINANLTIINSCNSGNSDLLQGGEGLISLGRGFFYAGSPTLILGRWSIKMGSTYKITKSFLEELQAGYSVSEALRQAKIKYLQNRSVSRHEKAPYYWAALSHWGKDQLLSF